MIGLDSEMRWLLGCLRRASQQQPGCGAGGGGRPDAVLAWADWHGVAPLLYWQLREATDPAVVCLMEPLAQRFQASLRHNALLVAALVKLLVALEQGRIKAIAFKGPTLAVQLYGNIGLRQSRDIDILLAPAQVAAAQAILTALGYQPLEPLTPEQAELRLRGNYERVWFQPATGVQVDLHWGLAPPYLTGPIAIPALLARAQSLTLAGLSLAVPAPADLLFILCLNGSKDGWAQFQRVCDVAACLRAFPDLDWGQWRSLTDQAASWRLAGLGLALAAQLLAAPLPAPVAAELAADRGLQTWRAAIAQRLLSPTERVPTLLEQAWFPLGLQESWPRQVRYCADLLLPLNERDLAWAQQLTGRALPKPLYPLYQPLRWLRLLLKHGCGWEPKPRPF